MTREEAIDLILAEYTSACSFKPSFHSYHEGLAVIEEEWLEFRAEVFKNASQRRPALILKEAVHASAMLLRFITELL